MLCGDRIDNKMQANLNSTACRIKKPDHRSGSFVILILEEEVFF